MKRILALLIAVLMVVGMLPATILSAAAESFGGTGGAAPLPNPGPGNEAPVGPGIDPEHAFAVYDEKGVLVSSYATLAEADAALADGYTLAFLADYDAGSEAFVFGVERAADKLSSDNAEFISYTIEGNGYTLTSSAESALVFGSLNYGDSVTIQNLTVVAAGNAIIVGELEPNAPTYINVTLQNCKLYAGNAYYLVDPSGYEEAPAYNESFALAASLGANVRILGAETEMLATEGCALATYGAKLFVEDGLYYSALANVTALLVGNTVAQIAGGTYLNDSAASVSVDASALTVTGGTFAVTGDAYVADATAPVAAFLCANGATISMTGGTVVLPADRLTGEAEAPARAVADTYVAFVSDDTDVKLYAYGMTLLVAEGTQFANNMDKAILGSEVEVSDLNTEEAGSCQLPFEKTIAYAGVITIALKADVDASLFAIGVTNADGALVAVFATWEDFEVALQAVPNGGALNLYVNIEVTDADFNGLFDNLPAIDVTVNGVGEDIAISTDIEGIMMTIDTAANITLTNIKLENKSSFGLFIGASQYPQTTADMTVVHNNATAFANGTITFGAGAAVVAPEGALWITAGTTVVVAEGATVGAVVVETGAHFVLNGGTLVGDGEALLVVGSTQVFGEFAATAATAAIELLAGKVQVSAGITSMLTTVNPAYTADMKIAAGVTIESLVLDDEDAPVASVVTGGDTLMVYDENGELVGAYASLVDVFEVIEDGYTVTMIGDHVETNKVDVALNDITWTLEGDGHNLYLLNGGIDFLGTGTASILQNMTIYSATYALQATGNTPSKIYLHDVFVYANGAVSKEYNFTRGEANPINLDTRYAEMIITGENSGAYSAAGMNLIYNEGFLAIYGGTYTSDSADYIINVSGTVSAADAAPNKLAVATLYLAGGKIVGNANGRFTILVHGGAKMIVTGGDIIAGTAENAVPVRFNSDQTNAYAWIFGGRFYTYNSDSFLQETTPVHNFVRFFGGEFYNLVEDARITTGTTELTKWTWGDVDYNYGYNLAAGYSAVNTPDYVASVENGDPAEVAGKTYVKQVVTEDATKLEALGYTVGAYTFVVKASRLVENAPEIGLYDPADLFAATVAAGPYEGTIELQKNVKAAHTYTTYTYTLGPAAHIVLTSAADAEDYYTYQSNSDKCLFRLGGGTFELENVTFENLAGQVVEVATCTFGETTFIVGEGAELSTNSSGIVAQKGTKVIVTEGGFVNAKSNALTNAAPAANLLRAKGDADFEIYGKVGYYRDGSIGDLGYWVAYNYEDGQAEIAPATGKSADLFVAGSAMIAGPNNSQDAQYLIRSRFYTGGSTDYTNLYSVNITMQPGAILQSNTAVMDARCGTQLDIDGIEIYSSNVNEDGSYNEYASVKGYAFYLHGVGGTFKNISFYNETTSFAYIASAGSPFSVEKGTIVFEDCTMVTGSNKSLLVVSASNDTNITINSGYYENKMNGNLILFSAEAEGTADSKGVLTINGGTFLKYYSAGMFKIQGNRKVVINGGDFESYNGGILGLTWESGKKFESTFEINGGTFETHNSYMFNVGHDNANINFTVNGGEFYVSRAVDPLKGDARTPTGIFCFDGESTLNINGGHFETEECNYFNSYMVRMMHKSTCNINGGDFYHLSNGGHAALASESSTININGGYLISNGDFVARPMAGASKNGTTLNPTVTTYSDATVNINGGVLMLINRTGNYTHPTNSVVSDGGTEQFGHLNINGGFLINARDEAFGEDVSSGFGISRQVVMKYHTVGSVVINGGIMIASPAQDYFFFSYGNAAGGFSIPADNIGVQKGNAPTIDIGGANFYYAVYAQNTMVAPELESAMDIELSEDETGLKFNAEITPAIYGALKNWAGNVAVQNEYAKDDYSLSYGMIVAPIETLLLTGGHFTVEAFEAYVEALATEARKELAAEIAAGDYSDEEIEAMEAALEEIIAGMALPYMDMPAQGLTESDEDGVAYFATLPLTTEEKEMRFVAVPYVLITLGTSTEETEDDRLVTYYGTFNSVKNSATIAEIAERALYDNTDEAIGAYQYPSILVKDAYNRYTAEEQAVLVTYLAHKHTFDYKGVCTDEECGFDASYLAEDGEEIFFYGDYNTNYYYTLNLKAGIPYVIDINRDVADYVLYDAEGNLCTVTKDVFTCAADGTYYLVLSCDHIGQAILTVAHVHQAGHTGFCQVCQEDLSITIDAEERFEQPVVKGNNYYYNVELTAGVSYTVITLNGIATVYDANGTLCPITENIFTAAGEAGTRATYYIVVAANYTSTAGTVHVQHVHSYDHTGLCTIEGCGRYIGISLDSNGVGNLYSNVGGRFEKGQQYFVHLTLAEGNEYFIRFSTYIGGFKLYNEQGEEILVGSGYTFTATYTGTYYLAVDVDTDVKSAKIYFGITHDHTYDHRGKCAFDHMGVIEECGSTNYKVITDGEPTTGLTLEPGVKYQFALPGARAGVTYHFEVPEGVVYRLFGNGTSYDAAHIKDISEGGTKLDYTTNNYCDPNSSRTLYIQLENTTEETMTNVSFTVSHIHQLDYTGKCTVSNCVGYNVGKTMQADTEITVSDYAAGNVYYRNLTLKRNVRYTPVITNAEMSWKIYNKSGTLVADSATGATHFDCTDTQTHYVVVTMVGEKVDADAAVVVKLASHEHAFDTKGTCTVDECDYSIVKNMDAAINAGYMDAKMPYADNYYGSINMIAGETYTFLFSSTKVSYKLYAADGTECVVANNAVLCTASGTYYMVITNSEASAGTLYIKKAHVCTSTATELSYETEDGKLYSYLPCDYCEDGKVSRTLVENAVVVTDTASAQAALDNATEGTWIYMVAGDYGTLYIRQSDLSVPVDMNDNWAGGGQNTFFRSFKGVKITGVEGTVVDSFVVEALTYTPEGNWHSQADEIAYLRSYIALEDIAISGIEFHVPTNGSAFNVAHGAISINNLTMDDCMFVGEGGGNVMYITNASEVKDVNETVILDGKVQNITLSNSVATGLYQVLNINDVENLAVVDNTFTDIADRGILLTPIVEEGEAVTAITGTITISGNVATMTAQRFIRMNTLTAVTVVVKGNTVAGQPDADDGSIAKFTLAAGSTVDLAENTWNTLDDASAGELVIVSIEQESAGE